MRLITSGAAAIVDRGWKAVAVAIVVGVIAIKAIIMIGGQVVEKSAAAIAAAFEPLKMFMAGLSGMMTMFIIVFGIIAVCIAVAKIRQ